MLSSARAWILSLLSISALLPGTPAADKSGDEERRQQLAVIENQWLYARDASTLERVLGDDFVHPVPPGLFLSKAEHIDWFKRHPAPANRHQAFARLDVRLYGNVGIVNGTVKSTWTDGRVEESIFTDVFVERGGSWQAVNAQENALPGPTPGSPKPGVPAPG
jgi:hypothetical protein